MADLASKNYVKEFVTSLIKKMKSNGDLGGGGNNYSTEEQVIGTWIDGKPLYRKVFTFNSSSTAGEEDTDLLSNEVEIINYDIIQKNGFAYNKGGQHPSSSSYSSWLYLTYEGTYIRICNRSGSGIAGGSYKAIIEYTKTTD